MSCIFVGFVYEYICMHARACVCVLVACALSGAARMKARRVHHRRGIIMKNKCSCCVCSHFDVLLLYFFAEVFILLLKDAVFLEHGLELKTVAIKVLEGVLFL